MMHTPPVSLARRGARRLSRLIRRGLRHERGVAAVEFSFILPVLITMYFGTVELSMAIGHERKSSLLARTLSDLVTQSANVTNSDMASIFAAAKAVLAPYPVDKLAMRVTSYRIDSAKAVFVDWSDVNNTNATGFAYTALGRCTDGSANVPTDLRIASTSIVMAEVTVNHMPVVGYIVAKNGIKMTESLPMRPRVSNNVTHEGVATTACPGEKV